MNEFDEKTEKTVKGFIEANNLKISEYRKKIEDIRIGKIRLDKTKQKERKKIIVDGMEMELIGLNKDSKKDLVPIGLGARETKERRIFEEELEKKKKIEIYINENFIKNLNELNAKLEEILASKNIMALKEAMTYINWIDSVDYTEKLRGKIQGYIDGLESR